MTDLQALSVREKLQLLEALREALVIEGSQGIRYGYGSLTEYRRAKREKACDEPIAEWIASFGPGDVFYDVGANIGGFALLAGKLHGTAVAVLAFEPGVENFAALARNIRLNDLSGTVTPLPVALSESTGVQQFFYRAVDAGGALHAIGAPVDYRGKKFTPAAVQPVISYTFDDVIERLALPRPTRIKLDVDGAESRVLAGAARTLTTSRCDL